MLVIGLTGPSGAGKNLVGDCFVRAGLPTIDADAVYHKLLLPPSACLNELVGAFGKGILCPDGTLDRKALGNTVFDNAEQLKLLNSISHRHVMETVKGQIAAYEADGQKAVVLNAPQLFEAGADALCDKIVSVLASPDVRAKRIMARDRIDLSAAQKRMRAQLGDDFFRSHSDFVIENNGTSEEAEKAVEGIVDLLGL